MPQVVVGGKVTHYPYTPKGRKLAAAAKSRARPGKTNLKSGMSKSSRGSKGAKS